VAATKSKNSDCATPDSLWSLLRLVQGSEKDYQSLLEAVQSLFSADGCSLFLQREHDHAFVLAALTGTAMTIPDETVILPGEGIAGAALVDQSPMLVGDPENTPNLRSRGAEKRSELESSMVVPLVVAGVGAVGVLNLSRRAGRLRFEANDLVRASEFASNLALIFENATLVRSLYRSQSILSQVMQAVEIGVCVFEADGSLLTINIPAGIWIFGNANTWEGLVRSLPVELATAARIGVLRVACPGDCFSQFSEVDGKVLRTTIVRLVGGGLAWTLHDETELVNAQQESAKLQRLAEIGQMTAAIAHEFRNPLTSISGAAKIIQDCPEETFSMAQIVREEVTKLSQLCDEFLEFARPLSLKKEPIHVIDLLIRVASLEGFLARETKIEIVVDAVPNGRQINLDIVRIEQVVRNLVRNAIQASSPGGIITLRAEVNGFSVEDAGTGISDEVLKGLFTPFHTTKPSGTGLGMCNVKKILDAHNGQITVEKLNPGTRFLVRFERSSAPKGIRN